MTERMEQLLGELEAGLTEDERIQWRTLLLSALPSSPDPESAIVHLTNLVQSFGNPRWLLDCLMDDPATLEKLLIVLGGSGFVGRTLMLHPEYLELLSYRQFTARPKELAKLQAELNETLRPFRTLAVKLDALRRFRRREMVRLIATDLLELLDLSFVTAELSNLAEAIVRTVFALVPAESDARLLIVAFGKLGACELNYSSDIDLVFFHDGAELAAERWVRRILQALSATTAHGRLFRVDLRLRPYGATAPLSLSLDAAIAYYESWADPSERMALLKARPIAGDDELSQRFERFRIGFVFRHLLEPEEFTWLLHVKARSESTFAVDTLLPSSHRPIVFSVKHGLGGIRDVEMTVQFLQLAFAHRFPDLAVRDTLTALQRLQAHGLLTPDEAQILRDSYRFLRRLEHMLQIAEDLPMQTLPTDKRELNRLARCMGFADGAGLLSAFHRHTQAVRKVYETVTKELAKALGVSEQTIVSLNIASGLEANEKTLRAFGFKRPSEAQRRLYRFAHGEMTATLPWHDRVRVMRVLPVMLDAISRTPDPDVALMRLENLAIALGARHAFLDTLSSNKIALRALALVASLSEPLCQLAQRNLEWLEVLLSGIMPKMPDTEDIQTAVWSAVAKTQGLLSGKQKEKVIGRLLGQLKGQFALRIGFLHLCRLTDGEIVGKALSNLADTIMDAALQAMCLPVSVSPCHLVAFALGGWGSGELHFGSDLDVVFAHEGRQEDAEQAVIRLRSLLGDQTEEGFAYRLDLRLRPTGQGGALSSDAKAWQEFTGERFEAWMALTWTRLRFAAGKQAIGDAVTQAVNRRLYKLGLTDEQWEELRHLLERICNEHRPPKGFMDLKHSEGALWDIELAVAEEQLREGRTNAEIRTPSVLAALRLLAHRSHKWQQQLNADLWLRQLRLWLSWIAPYQHPRFVFGDALEQLLAWLDANPQPLTQLELVPLDDAVESFRKRWIKVTASA